ncbi:MAG TPA: tetratricopeptide repeat protein, partial [Sedimentisphaerales bacterium]|nr:tetratricopeptide repeat protein [Sedimentisphaerales bacterium]
EALNYPIENLDVLEISPQVVRASDYFRPWNNDALDDPRTNLIIQDGRAHLEHTNRRYDVIISAPSNVWMAGLATLFTVDFYEQVKQRLNDDGIFVQFLYAYQIDWDSFAMMGRTFAHVFPNSILICNEPSTLGTDYLLVGFKSPQGRLDPEVARARLQYVKRSKNVRLRNTDLLFRMIVSEDLPSLFGTGHINTDDRPRLEFTAPKMIYLDEHRILAAVQAKKTRRPETMAIIDALSADPNSRIDFAEYAMSVYRPFHEMVDMDALDDAQRQRVRELVAAYAAENQIMDLTVDDGTFRGELLSLVRQVQINILQTNMDQWRDRAKAKAYTGDLLTAEGRFQEAIPMYKAALEMEPDSIVPRINLGVAYFRSGDIDSAIEQFRAVLRRDPDLAAAHTYLGHMLRAQGRHAEAEIHFNAAQELAD